LFAVAATSAPSALILLLAMALAFAVISRGRFAIAGLIALPASALTAPYLVYQGFLNDTPLAVFADPTISYPSKPQSALQALIGHDQILGWAAIALLAIAGLSLLSKAKSAFGIGLLALLALVNLVFTQSIRFSAGGTGSIFLDSADFVFSSPTPSVMLLALCALLAMGIWLDRITRVGLRRLLVGLVVVGLAPLSISSMLTPSVVAFGDSRNLPAIFEAESKAGNDLRLLTISKTGEPDAQEYRAELIRPGGLRLDSVSTSYRFSSQNLTKGLENSTKGSISELVGNLVSANGQDLVPALKEAGIGYVLVTDNVANADLAVSLNSVAELDQVGATEFGQLWRVKASESFKVQDKQTYWSITKSIQLGVLVGFILLALPTSRGRKSRSATQSLAEDSFQLEEEQQ
jgi:hypothetical protein